MFRIIMKTFTNMRRGKTKPGAEKSEEKYTLLDREIGRGATSRVVLCIRSATQKRYALKKFTEVKDCQKERDILSRLHHPGVINFVEELHHPPLIGLVLEYAPKGELFGYLDKAHGFPIGIARFYFRELIETLEYLHNEGIVHRDLKLENLLLGSDFSLKIADFGSAIQIPKDKSEHMMDYVSTFMYAAPEIVARKEYDGEAADLFACGVLLFMMCTGRPPFGLAHSSDRTYQRIINNDVDEMFWSSREDSKQIDDEQLKDLLLRMLAYQVEDRLTLQEIKKHPWYRGETLSQGSVQAYMRSLEGPSDEVDEVPFGVYTTGIAAL